VPVIQCCDFGELQALRDGDHGGIDHTKRKVCVGLHEFGHALDVVIF
jgi:hypothetical protein